MRLLIATITSGILILLMALGSAGHLYTLKADVFKTVADVPLPGGATRFDYQSFDPKTGRLFISHMGDGKLLVFDTKNNRVIAHLTGFSGVTGVRFIPELNRVYASAAGSHEVVAVDAGSLTTLARTGGADFPDGLAYASDVQKVYVSDESGGKELVIDAKTNKRAGLIDLGGEAGNTQYDAVSKHIFVAVQTRNLMAEVDPKTDRIIARHPLPGSEHPHGFYIDSPRRLMFVSCEGNARLLIVDMRTMKVTSTESVGADPDVLAFDPSLQRLYVACESGVVNVFDEKDGRLIHVTDIHAPASHSVSADPATHRIYLPLKNVGGKPVLRIMEPESRP